ncbi:PPE domain-containing protein [Nocardia abscessus]|nr:PPE domain-containing protein [Nocardia abscessus]
MAFDYLALPPEVNTGRLLSGPGAAALASTAAAYATLATGLAVAASETDGLTVMLGVAWQGPASDVAQAAFGRHAAWLHTQSAVALDAVRGRAGGDLQRGAGSDDGCGGVAGRMVCEASRSRCRQHNATGPAHTCGDGG